jgi:hypothetical protein
MFLTEILPPETCSCTGKYYFQVILQKSLPISISNDNFYKNNAGKLFQESLGINISRYCKISLLLLFGFGTRIKKLNGSSVLVYYSNCFSELFSNSCDALCHLEKMEKKLFCFFVVLLHYTKLCRLFMNKFLN